MYCTKCGVQLKDGANFCSDCGSPTASNAYSVRPYPKLSRPREDRKIAGVCAGFARYLGVDVTLVRVVTLILAIWPVGLGLIGYVVAWIVMPNDPLRLPAAQPASPEPANGHA
ncbi:MAG TPA: PspC domain-containing protein [Bryobacteraceae bacterium]|nr:PspC domain-containing protein [Bryobacteraceae bacterium]